MGYYIQFDTAQGKADKIVELYGGQKVTLAEAKQNIGNSSIAVIIVVDNGPFEAAAFAFDSDEFNAFTRADDYRPKQFVLMNRNKAKELTNYKG